MTKDQVLHDIISLYKSNAPINDKIERTLNLLNQAVPCQAASIFLFDEYGGCLKLMKGTNIKKSIKIPSFESDSPLWKMFESDKPKKIANRQIKGAYPTTDVFFENIPTVKTIAFSPIFNAKNNRIGVIRLLNKIKDEENFSYFIDSDLITLDSFANVIGALFTISTLQSRYEAFLDSVTHELLAPISGIKNDGFFMRRVATQSDLRNNQDLQEAFNSKIEDIIGFSKQAIALIQGLTMYTQSGRMSQADLILKPSHLFKHIIDKSRGSLTPLLVSRKFKHDAIRCFNRSQWPLLNLDRQIFRQVFNNILSNSIKYAHGDKSAFNILIELETLRNGDVIITIQDYGIGLEKDEADKIFDPTFRGKNARAKVTTGTGIGLTTVRNLLLAHETKIVVTNLKNPTEFTITIPKKYVIRRRNDHIYR